MKTIFGIFGNDIKSIVKHFFVLVIVIALGVLPALYAWVNIYACWDPYGNTENMKVAISSRDRGIYRSDGTHINKADEVIARVQDDTSIKYVPVEDPDQAIQDVKAGKYYAAYIFEDGFTYDMEHFEDAINDEDARIMYYYNTKKNAIGPKVTDGVATKLLSTVNEEYLRTVLGRFFGDTKEFADSLDTDEAVDDVIEQLTQARDAMHQYNVAIDQYLASSGSISGVLSAAKGQLDTSRREGKADMAKARKIYQQTKKDLKAVSRGIRSRVRQVDKSIDALDEIIQALKQPIDEKERQKLIEQAEEIADEILTELEALRALIPGEGDTPASRIAASTLDLMIDAIEKIKEDVKEPSRIDAVMADLQAIKKINEEELLPVLKQTVSEVEKALKLTKPLLSSTSALLDDIDPIIDSAGRTLTSLDRTLISLQGTLGPLEDRLDDLIQKVEDADQEDKADILMDFLGGDPDRYTSFFVSPVKIRTETIYPVVAYGAAMAPFYTIIALWVGGVMLVTLMNTNIDRRKYPQATEAQGFFGRYLIFFLLGQIQAAVVIAGDIFLLHCSPVHPWLMWLSAAVTSFVFGLLIYALVLSFGNVGRAAVIVIMVLQISGSSGSFPIEVLPELFGKIYKFFPFPYGINAMREAICGLYGADYLIYLGQLLPFAALAVLIGLFIRKPFIGVDRYVTEKLEETEVL